MNQQLLVQSLLFHITSVLWFNPSMSYCYCVFIYKAFPEGSNKPTVISKSISTSLSYLIIHFLHNYVIYFIVFIYIRSYSHIISGFVIYSQFVRKRSGKLFGSSWTECRTQRSTESGFTPASMKTSAWTTWPRISAALRSTWTWSPGWVWNHFT